MTIFVVVERHRRGTTHTSLLHGDDDDNVVQTGKEGPDEGEGSTCASGLRKTRRGLSSGFLSPEPTAVFIDVSHSYVGKVSMGASAGSSSDSYVTYVGKAEGEHGHGRVHKRGRRRV